MKSPAWGRGAVPLGATEGLGGGAKVLFETISSDTPAAYYTLVCGVSFSWPSVASKAHRQPFNERREPGREQAVHPSYSRWGFRILDRRTTMRAASRAPQRQAVSFPSAACRSHSNFPAEQGERAMPMLFWLPMIFVSALWEINGFPPRALANNDQAPV
jgi:hypothetical protein